LKRGEIWWANLGSYRPMEQTGRRPVVISQSDELIRMLQSVVVIPLTTNVDRSRIFGTAIVAASEIGPPEDSVALGFQIRTIAKSALLSRIRALTAEELADLESATDEAFGRTRP
jgi:mRNA interferase MazF